MRVVKNFCFQHGLTVLKDACTCGNGLSSNKQFCLCPSSDKSVIYQSAKGELSFSHYLCSHFPPCSNLPFWGNLPTSVELSLYFIFKCPLSIYYLRPRTVTCCPKLPFYFFYSLSSQQDNPSIPNFSIHRSPSISLALPSLMAPYYPPSLS